MLFLATVTLGTMLQGLQKVSMSCVDVIFRSDAIFGADAIFR